MHFLIDLGQRVKWTRDWNFKIYRRKKNLFLYLKKYKKYKISVTSSRQNFLEKKIEIINKIIST